MNYRYAWNKDTFDEIDPRYTDYVLGILFLVNRHMIRNIRNNICLEEAKVYINICVRAADQGLFI